MSTAHPDVTLYAVPGADYLCEICGPEEVVGRVRYRVDTGAAELDVCARCAVAALRFWGFSEAEIVDEFRSCGA